VAIDDTALFVVPGGSETIYAIAAGDEVELLGQARSGWVQVELDDGVVPGWVPAAVLRRAGSGTRIPGDTDTAAADATATPAPVQVDLEVDQPLPDPPPPSPVPQQAIPIAVLLVQTHVQTGPGATPVPGAPTPTPDLARMREEQPMAGMRVQLVNVFGDVLTEAVTPDDGRVTLARDVPPGTALQVFIPAAGVLVPVDLTMTTPDLVIAIPVRTGPDATGGAE
jgi:hypothetical protein